MLHIAYYKLAHIRTERAVALLLWVVLFSALFAYGYFIVSSVVNVMLRQELMVTIRNTEAAVSSLESEYLARAETLTDTNVLNAGLVTITSVKYVRVATGEDRLSRLP